MPVQREFVREDCRRVGANPATLASLKGAVILVTGGTGFLGSWLTEMIAMLNDEHNFGLHATLLSTSARSFATRLPHLGKRRDISLIQADTANVTELSADTTHIIHAAASPDSSQHASDPLRLIRTVVTGTQMILEATTRLPSLQQMLNISSGQIYGSMAPDAKPADEQTFVGFDSSSTANTYAEAKRMGEQLASTYRRQHRLPIVNVRPFAFVGPYQRLDRPWAINNFIQDALNGSHIRIHGDGQSARSYMYGADAAWWLLSILAHGKVGTSYNIGSDQAIRLIDVAHMVADMQPTRPKILTSLFGDGVPRSSFVPAIGLARSSLGLDIMTPLDVALERTIQWNRDAV